LILDISARRCPVAKPLVDDDLWNLIAPLLPPPKPRRRRHPGRRPLDDRAVFTGILFVLKTGIPWEDLPQEMGCGSGMTCWRRLRDWQAAGVWEKIHRVVLDRLRAADRIDWSRAVVDSASLRAVGGGEKNRPQSHRSKKARKQTPPAHRRPWHSPERAPDGRQSP
jgi:transposase